MERHAKNSSKIGFGFAHVDENKKIENSESMGRLEAFIFV